MEHRVFGKTGLNVSVLGFGGSEIGRSDIGTVEKLLGAAIDAGLNVIDTAECYNDSEALIGQAVSARRGDYHLFTKVGHAAGLGGGDWNPKTMAESIDRSLKRLQTDTVDLIQLHSCGEEKLRQGDVVDVLRRARDAGKTRFIGYSGDRQDALYAVESGAFDALQTSVSVADQQVIDLGTLDKAKAAGMGVIAKRPIANAAWMRAAEKPADEYSAMYWEYSRAYSDRLRALDFDWASPDEPARAATVALLFTLAQAGVDTAIVGTRNPERWRQNAQLIENGPLSGGLLQQIRDRWREVSQPDWVGQT